MFDTQNNAFRKLFEEGKKYINLQIDYAKLTATEKISVILGMSVLFAVILVLSVGAGIYLSFALVYLLEPLVGIVGSYAIVGAVFLLLIAIVILFKKKLILVPITRFISKVLLDNEKILYKMNENHTNQQGLTLEEIAVHKQALKIAIAEQQKNVNEAYRQVVAPFSEAKSVSGYIGGRLLNSFTMIESAIWGFRLISRIFRIFRKFR
jgi:hypothetical protein